MMEAISYNIKLSQRMSLALVMTSLEDYFIAKDFVETGGPFSFDNQHTI